MTHDDALALLADHPHAWRYRQLCDEGNRDVEQRDAYRSLVIRMARGEPAGTPDPPDGRPSAAESLSVARRMNACPYRSLDAPCGCSGGRCALRRGAAVSHLDCFDCLRRYP